jgi:hypothetical protein
MHDLLRDIREVVREEMFMRDKLLATLLGGPKTVPEIAEDIGSPTHEVMHWIMAARKYGYVEESKEPTDEDYYQYAIVQKD